MTDKTSFEVADKYGDNIVDNVEDDHDHGTCH